MSYTARAQLLPSSHSTSLFVLLETRSTYRLASGCINRWEHVSVILVGFQDVTFFLIVLFSSLGKKLTIGSDF